MSEKADADPMVHAEDLARWAAAYAGSDHDPGSSGLSPLFADLSGLPPLLVEVGTAEVLLDDARRLAERARAAGVDVRSEEHTSELQSLMRISYAVFCLKKKKTHTKY